MSGVSDKPFRRLAQNHAAGLVVSEMVASEELVQRRPDMVRRTAGCGSSYPFVIQLAGRQERWMAEGARMASDLGADVIDINMGCPAREVTGVLSGSALMRDLDHALRLIEATVTAVEVPVTLKMRLGWDHNTVNAPELAARAETAGVSMITVHGRTRCQFYKGRADWKAIAAVRRATSLPLIVNGDGKSIADVRAMLEQSGADGVMIGRGSYGRPWLTGELAELLDPGTGIQRLSAHEQLQVAILHYDSMLAFYGCQQGLRIARKHLGWYVAHWHDEGCLTGQQAQSWRRRLVREDDPRVVQRRLVQLKSALLEETPRAA